MTSPFVVSADWNVWGVDDNSSLQQQQQHQQQQRGRSRSQYNESRPRARSADARPQYSSSSFRQQHYADAFPYESTEAELSENQGIRYPTQLSKPSDVYSTSDKIVMVPGDPYNATTKGSEHPPQHFGAFQSGWSPEDDKHRRQQAVPRSSFPEMNDPGSMQQQLEQVEPTKERGKGGLRSSIMKSSMVEKLKGLKKPSSSSSSGRRPWNLIPSLSRSRSLSPTTSGNKPSFRNNNKVQKGSQQLSNNNPNVPLPARRTLNVKEQRGGTPDFGSFDVDFDFFGDGFTQSIPETTHHESHSNGFEVIRPTKQNAPRTAPQQTQSQYSEYMPGDSEGRAPISYSQYISNSKIRRSDGPFKISPTSVTDINSNFSVRWSDNLSQSPTRTPDDHRLREETPKSILRSTHLNQSISSDDYPSVETPTIEFVDPRNGRSLSPIGPMKERLEEMPKWMETESGFEKNIPEEYQQAFYQQSVQANSRKDDSIISEAYNEFIESVASVVLQTAVRQFLAKARVRRLREEVAAAKKYKYNRKRIERGQRSSGVKSVRSQDSRTAMIARAKHENQLFELAAIRIQSIFRGWWVRDSTKVDHYCASIIQKNFRAYRCRNLFLYDLYRVEVVQSFVRGHLVRKSLGNGQEDLEIRRVLGFASTMIQSRWRSFAAEMRFLRTYRDILIVQSVVRGWIVRQRMMSQSKTLDGRGSIPSSRNYGSRLRLAQQQKKSSQKSYLPAQSHSNHSWHGQSSPQQEGKSLVKKTTTSKGVRSSTKDFWRTKNQSSPQQETTARTTARGIQSQVHQEGKAKAAKSDIDKRREAKELQRQAVLEEENRRKEREASSAAELKRMQRRVGVKTQASPQMEQRSPAPSAMEETNTQKRYGAWGSEVHRSSQSNNMAGAAEVQRIGTSGSFDSDIETEIQSNRSSTSRLLDGWGNRERSNSLDRKSFGDNTFERIREIESQGNARLSGIGGRNSFGDSKDTEKRADESEHQAPEKQTGIARRLKNSPRPVKSKPSVQHVLRAKRSDKENLRINQMHEIFVRVGLLQPIEHVEDAPVEETFQNPANSAEPKQEKPKKVEQKENVFTSAKDTQQMFSASSSSSFLKTERKLFSEDEANASSRANGRLSATAGNYRSSYPPPRKEMSEVGYGHSATSGNQRFSYPPRANTTMQRSTGIDSTSENGPGIERSKRLMQSLGLNTSYASEASTDVSDIEDERTDPAIPTSSTFANMPEPKREATANIQSSPRKLTSEIHIQMKAKRDEGDQLRIDQMHEIFQRVGLMHRYTATTNNKSVVPIEGSGSNEIETNSSEPTATDLIKSWRQRDQTRPSMSGKIF